MPDDPGLGGIAAETAVDAPGHPHTLHTHNILYSYISPIHAKHLIMTNIN